jgi:hypothetical protein
MFHGDLFEFSQSNRQQMNPSMPQRALNPANPYPNTREAQRGAGVAQGGVFSGR